MKLGKDQQTIGIRSMDHVANVDLPQPNAPAHWGGYARVLEIELHAIDIGLIGAHRTLKLPHQEISACHIAAEE